MESREIAQGIVEEILTRLGVSFTITLDESANELNIDSDDHALLIGQKGESLRSLQHIVNSIMKRQNPEGDWCIIDVAGYKKERIGKLKAIADSVVKEVVTSGRDKPLPTMNSFERREIHTYLADNSEVITESEGQEPHRVLVVKKA